MGKLSGKPVIPLLLKWSMISGTQFWESSDKFVLRLWLREESWSSPERNFDLLWGQDWEIVRGAEEEKEKEQQWRRGTHLLIGLRGAFCTMPSVTRWLYYLFNVWPFRPMKNCQRILKFCQSGRISPNLVTLLMPFMISKWQDQRRASYW